MRAAQELALEMGRVVVGRWAPLGVTCVGEGDGDRANVVGTAGDTSPCEGRSIVAELGKDGDPIGLSPLSTDFSETRDALAPLIGLLTGLNNQSLIRLRPAAYDPTNSPTMSVREERASLPAPCPPIPECTLVRPFADAPSPSPFASRYRNGEL